ncbi:hypothetical protein AMATHDRAFT_51588 [Amanita thiersii Skay4041]|uniref:GST N-terminal domain-containing protein n=1 Tax=Amanita thiersii Skay4041 TaxID=703135 RepID=A0A2A9NBF2_9AGAR|nr:hypothetical protein AMATHDRAFT_51588 [Amanita thiersii Skay4041]
MSQKPFLLYAAPTVNGFPISAFLEELKAVYPEIEYDVELIDIWGTRHKEPWFLKMNPNGRIPVLVDRLRNNFSVFETSAIMLYLVQHYDKDFKFGFDPAKDPDEYSVLLQWLFFSHGGLGPMQGQGLHNYFASSVILRHYPCIAHHFHQFVKEDIPYPKKRYHEETKRLYGVFEMRLQDRDYLAGPGRGHYTIADGKAWPWVRRHIAAAIPTLDEWPNLKAGIIFSLEWNSLLIYIQAWLKRCLERPATEQGIKILSPST